MKGSIRIGRILGIEIDIHYSWLLVLGLVWVNLATGYFPAVHPEMSPRDRWAVAMATAILFFASILFHELCHSVVANRRGVGVSRITLFVFGGISHLREEVRDAATEFRIAVAGPASSLALAALFFLVGRLALALGGSPLFTSPTLWLAFINLLLATFNLLPGLPLDGGRLLRAAVWYFSKSFVKSTRVAATSGAVIAYMLMAFGIVQMVRGGQGWAGGIWFLLIGWFLQNAAQSSFSHAALEQALAGAKVADVMTRNILTIPPDTTLQQAVEEFFLVHRFTAFPVEEQGRILGMVNLDDIHSIGRDQWPSLAVRQAMKPIDLREMAIDPEQEAVRALMKMAETGQGRLLVFERGSDARLLGLITRTDLMNFIRVKTGLGI